mmetsp:Transcript_5451/g.16127  ORF Transcript_5451/g.16127 Transcript_5451/m.16127 type:complete len:230 (-) Transcript_5451:863-1552(-)
MTNTAMLSHATSVLAPSALSVRPRASSQPSWRACAALSPQRASFGAILLGASTQEMARLRAANSVPRSPHSAYPWTATSSGHSSTRSTTTVTLLTSVRLLGSWLQRPSARQRQATALAVRAAAPTAAVLVTSCGVCGARSRAAAQPAAARPDGRTPWPRPLRAWTRMATARLTGPSLAHGWPTSSASNCRWRSGASSLTASTQTRRVQSRTMSSSTLRPRRPRAARFAR